MNQSPLYESHISIGAEFNELHGWKIPAHYGDPVAEHLSVRSSIGIMDMTHRGKIRISGKDRTKFLQNILTQDINKLTPGAGGHAALLNTKGHMLAYMRIFSDEDSFLIDTETGESDKVIQILNHYLFREDVKIEDLTLKYGLVTIQGPHSIETICSISGTEIKDMEECSHVNITIDDIKCKIARTTYTGEEGYSIYTPWDNLNYIWETITMADPFIPQSEQGSESHSIPDSKISPFGYTAYNSLRIEAGIPLYSVDMDEGTIPLEANLDQAVSYTKGCYIGQETIARINFKGHVNRKLTGFSLPMETAGTKLNSATETCITPQKGDRIYKLINNTEQNIGVTTSVCFSPTLKRIIALGYLKIEHNEPGNEVIIKSESNKFPAQVASLPFYKP